MIPCPDCKTPLEMRRHESRLSNVEPFYRAHCPGCGFVSFRLSWSPTALARQLKGEGLIEGWRPRLKPLRQT